MNKISVIIPAHNEEKYIGKCLDSIKAAELQIDIPVEIVVSLNRCKDRTEIIARDYGAITVTENEKIIAKIRNSGVQASTGDVLVTIDADSWMSQNMLYEVLHCLRSGKYIGGGVWIWPERMSIGIFFTLLMILPYLIKPRVTAGLFWAMREDFDAVGGFDETRVSVEDIHFALKLKNYGRKKGLKYGTITRAHIVTSCRKFDHFGDWYMVKNPRLVKQLFSGMDRKAANLYYYDVER